MKHVNIWVHSKHMSTSCNPIWPLSWIVHPQSLTSWRWPPAANVDAAPTASAYGRPARCGDQLSTSPEFGPRNNAIVDGIWWLNHSNLAVCLSFGHTQMFFKVTSQFFVGQKISLITSIRTPTGEMSLRSPRSCPSQHLPPPADHLLGTMGFVKRFKADSPGYESNFGGRKEKDCSTTEHIKFIWVQCMFFTWVTSRTAHLYVTYIYIHTYIYK